MDKPGDSGAFSGEEAGLLGKSLQKAAEVWKMIKAEGCGA